MNDGEVSKMDKLALGSAVVLFALSVLANILFFGIEHMMYSNLDDQKQMAAELAGRIHR